jgi:xylitol oxidase
MAHGLTNWAGNVRFAASRLLRPASLGELQRQVAGSRRCRALGTGHSFSMIADTGGELISLAGLPPVAEIDSAAGRVRAAAGLRYGELACRLHRAGFALANLASLPHISLGGACATGTHGSGDQNACLAAAVTGLELVTASGDLVSLSRGADPAAFGGVVVGLGALGVVTTLTLDLVPAFEVSQRVYAGLPAGALISRSAEVFASGYSVSAFIRWGRERTCQLWVKQVAGPFPDDLLGSLGARAADGPRHPVPGMPPENCTPQLGLPGPWHERLPHFRPGFTPSAGDELQSEYLVPRRAAAGALRAIEAVSGAIAPVLQVCEIRTVAADDLWLSMASGRDSLAIHFTWVPDQTAVTPVLGVIEKALAPLRARPHWGKLFTTEPEDLAGLYPRLSGFAALARRLDPGGKFRNAFLAPLLSAAALSRTISACEARPRPGTTPEGAEGTVHDTALAATRRG